MVVGADVCTPLDMLPHKKRRSEYGGCGSPSKRQCASPAQSAPSPLSPDGLQAEPQTSTVVLLGDEGGIWHVDGLLELLTGALCAALCGDPAALSTLAPCAGPDGSSSSGCGSEAVTSTATHVTPTPDPEHGAAQVSAAAAKTVAPAGAAGRPSLASTPGPASTPAAARPGPAPAALLTEANLQRHITQQQQHERAEDDVVSEASLSEWIYGATASPRSRASSESPAGWSSPASPAGPAPGSGPGSPGKRDAALTPPSSTFTFRPWTAPGPGQASPASCSPTAAARQAHQQQLQQWHRAAGLAADGGGRWPRRRLSLSLSLSSSGRQ